MPQIVIATCLELPEVLPSDQQLVDELETRQAEVTSAPWNGPFASFARADLVIVRTTWDYFTCLEKFYAWFDELERRRIQVANPLRVLRWNCRKDYLLELQKQGLPVVESVAVAADYRDILKQMNIHAWDRAVLKCMVSGGALGMSVIEAKQSSVESALATAEPYSNYGLMLQPFLPEIQTNGELSLIFIAGEFSHAIRKVPRDGDFRVQSEFGGKYYRVDVSSETLATARRCLNASPGMPNHPPLYARIDGPIVAGKFQLMEMELTEPELMLDMVPEAAKLMADAALRIANDQPTGWKSNSR